MNVARSGLALLLGVASGVVAVTSRALVEMLYWLGVGSWPRKNERARWEDVGRYPGRTCYGGIGAGVCRPWLRSAAGRSSPDAVAPTVILRRFRDFLPMRAGDLIWFLPPLAVLVALVGRWWLAALFLFLAGATGVLIPDAIKLLVARPAADLVRVLGLQEIYGFPSGTAFLSVVLLVLVAAHR